MSVGDIAVVRGLVDALIQRAGPLQGTLIERSELQAICQQLSDYADLLAEYDPNGSKPPPKPNRR